MASQHHPDRGGETSLFQDIQEAYDTLSDPQRRAAYDSPPPRFQTHFSGSSPFDFNEIFQVFGVNIRPNGTSSRSSPPRMQLWLDLTDIIQGGPRIVSVQTDHGINNIEINIPPGLQDGDNIRYPGLAPGGRDLVINYRIRPDQRFQRDGLNLITEHRVPIWDLILGTEITILGPTNQKFLLTVPARTQPNSLLRLKGKGLPSRRLPGDNPHGASGDLLVRMIAVIPEHIEPDVLAVIQSLQHR